MGTGTQKNSEIKVGNRITIQRTEEKFRQQE